MHFVSIRVVHVLFPIAEASHTNPFVVTESEVRRTCHQTSLSQFKERADILEQIIRAGEDNTPCHVEVCMHITVNSIPKYNRREAYHRKLIDRLEELCGCAFATLLMECRVMWRKVIVNFVVSPLSVSEL